MRPARLRSIASAEAVFRLTECTFPALVNMGVVDLGLSCPLVMIVLSEKDSSWRRPKVLFVQLFNGKFVSDS